MFFNIAKNTAILLLIQILNSKFKYVEINNDALYMSVRAYKEYMKCSISEITKLYNLINHNKNEKII